MSRSISYSTQLFKLLKSDPLAGRLHSIPIMIFCAKQEELTLAIETLNHSKEYCSIEPTPIIDSDGNHFIIGSFEVNSGSESNVNRGVVEFYVVCGPRQGPESAASYASRFMTLYNPKFALSVGICAGIPGKIRIGDVLFACRAVNYQAGKRNKSLDPKAVNEDFEPDLHILAVKDAVRNRAIDLIESAKNDVWCEGCMITGSSVMKDIELLLHSIKKYTPRDMKGLDMETSAFYTSCVACHVEALPVIKAVSDMGDEAKSDSTHRLCIQRAVAAAMRFLIEYFSHQREHKHWKVDISKLVFGRKYQKSALTGQIVEYIPITQSSWFSPNIDYSKINDPYTCIDSYLASGITDQSDPKIYFRYEQNIDELIPGQVYGADKKTGRMMLINRKDQPRSFLVVDSLIAYREKGLNLVDQPRELLRYPGPK